MRSSGSWLVARSTQLSRKTHHRNQAPPRGCSRPGGTWPSLLTRALCKRAFARTNIDEGGRQAVPPGDARRLHLVRQGDVVGEDVELEALRPDHAAHDLQPHSLLVTSGRLRSSAYLSGVDSHPHVHLLASVDVELPDGDDHVQAHLHSADRVVRTRLGTAGDTVVAVTCQWTMSRGYGEFKRKGELTQGADFLQASHSAKIVESEIYIIIQGNRSSNLQLS